MAGNEECRKAVLQMIRELTEVAKVLRLFDKTMEADPSRAELPLIEPLAPTESREVNALVNMFNVTLHLYTRHVGLFRSIIPVPAEETPPARHTTTILSFGVDNTAQAFAHTAPAMTILTIERLRTLVGGICEEHGGMAQHTPGGSIIAVFGLDDKDHATKACTCGLALLGALDQFNHFQTRRKLRPLKCSIGIHTAETIIGTTHGDQGANLELAGQALSGANTLRLPASERVRPLLMSADTAQAATGVRSSPLPDIAVSIEGVDVSTHEIAQPPPLVDYCERIHGLFGESDDEMKPIEDDDTHSEEL
jgi:class 3 adenylate cyclase